MDAPGRIYTKVGPVPARLTDAAAGALDQYLGASFGAVGIPPGTAYVYARFARPPYLTVSLATPIRLCALPAASRAYTKYW